MYQLKDLHIRLTSKCNLNCMHCYAADWFKQGIELSLPTIKSAINQSMDLGCEKVTFTGGEPLLHENICDLIEFCIVQNLRVSLETNGILLNNSILRRITKPELVSYKVSYDGEKMRGKKSTEIVKENLKFLVDYGFDVKIQTVITRFNLQDVEQIFNFTRSLGISNRVFLGHSRTGNAKELPIFFVDQVLKIKEDLSARYAHLTIELPMLISGKHQKGCGWGTSRCELMPNGDVTSCGPLTFARRDFKAGNICDMPLRDLWNSKHFVQIRELTQDQFIGVCSTCEYFKDCKGSCRSISASIGGELLSSYPYCEQYAKIK
jgi:radical SAM protein with 4Fe4S-binding SPASM domain